jgi:PAS domain S-box-containing protein
VKTHVELFLSKQDLHTEVADTKVLLEQYKAAVDSNSLVSKTNINGIITYANDKFCEVSKYSRKELVGSPHNIARHPDVSPKIFEDMWSTIKSKKVWNGIVKNLAKDGTTYYVDATVMPITNSHGDVIEYISVRTDITQEVLLREEIISSQKEILHTLGELGEWRSQETGEHVQRVSLFSEVLAKAYGCDEKESDLLKMASPMHDIGKVIIPDAILLKPGKLTPDEFETMKNHTVYGWEIFNKSQHDLLKAAARISYEHHEKWDGTGYPRGLKGEDIHIFGRITAVADVFDALSHDRVYKKAWSVEETLEFIQKESGKAFDPKIVELLLENIEQILEIKKTYAG